MLIDSQHKVLKNSILKMLHQAEDWSMSAGLKFDDRSELTAAASRIETLCEVKAILDNLEKCQDQVYASLRY